MRSININSRFDCLTDEDLEQVVGGCEQNFAAFNTCMNVSDYFGALGMSELSKSFHDMGVAYGKGTRC